MNENKKTLILVVSAVVLALLAAVSSPRSPQAEIVSDQGKPFYPEFTNGLKATSLEVSEYDEKRAKANIFKVAMVGGRWSIPSHHDYPADAEKKLGRVAASMVDVRKETFRTDRPQDYKDLGVLDPLDPSGVGEGRGRRVVLKDTGGRVLCDYIFGKETKEGSGVRYVRVPDQKKVYTAHLKLEISTKFEDWIELDLLKATQSSIRKVTIDNYSIDTDQGRIKNRATYFLTRDDSAGPWKVSAMKEGEEPNTENISAMLSAITELKIMGVRPKPGVLVKHLKAEGDFILKSNEVTREQYITLKALEASGYYTVPLGNGQIQMLSNDGEIQAACDDGTVYTLRFGDVVVGEGEGLTSGAEEKKDEKKPPKPEAKDDKKTGPEGRYLFVTVKSDESLIPPLPPEPSAPPGYKPDEKKGDPKDPKKDDKAEKKDDSPEVAKYKKDKEDWDRKKTDREKKIADGKKRAQELTDRFADWYYVISAETFKKLRKDLKDLVKPKEAKKDEKKDDEHKHDEKKDGDKKDEKKPEEKKDPEKKPEEKKPEDPKDGAKKPDEKKPEDKKPDEKKPDGPKSEDKKPDEKKPDGPKPEDKKPDEKKP